MTPRLVPPWHVLVESRQRRACPRHVRFVALHVRNDGASRGFCQSVLGHDPGPPARNRWSELVAMICLVGQSWRFLQAAPDGPDQPEFAAQKRHERSRRFGGRPARSLNHESSTRRRSHRRVLEWRQLSSFRSSSQVGAAASLSSGDTICYGLVRCGARSSRMNRWIFQTRRSDAGKTSRQTPKGKIAARPIQ